MGKLIAKLERIRRMEGPRLGFGPSLPKTQLTMLLVGVLPEANRELAAAAVESGADCLLIRRAKTVKSGGTLAQALGIAEGIPCGAEVAGSPSADGAGWDFAVLEAKDPVGRLLRAEGMDTALRLEADPPDVLLRALESLPVDAVTLPEPPASLTIEALLPYYRVARATSKPVLAHVAAGEEALLAALRDAGIAGLLVAVENAAQAKALARLRKAIAGLPPKRARAGRTQLTASLGMTPMPQPPADTEIEEDDEEE